MGRGEVWLTAGYFLASQQVLTAHFASGTVHYRYPDPNTLVTFYVIYVPDLPQWVTINDFTEDHKDKLVALQVTLNLCLYTYRTTMQFGATETTEVSKVTDLKWQNGSQLDGSTSYPTVTTTYGSDTFWMYQNNVKSFNQHLAYETFVGSASLNNLGPEPGFNTTTGDTARMITQSYMVAGLVSKDYLIFQTILLSA